MYYDTIISYFFQNQTPIVLAVHKGNEDCADVLLRGPHFKDARSYQKFRR